MDQNEIYTIKIPKLNFKKNIKKNRRISNLNTLAKWQSERVFTLNNMFYKYNL